MHSSESAPLTDCAVWLEDASTHALDDFVEREKLDGHCPRAVVWGLEDRKWTHLKSLHLAI